MNYNTFGDSPKKTNRHKVFVSYHHANDQYYRNYFESLFSETHDIMVSKSVQIGDINTYLSADAIRQKIRDEYLRDSTVTIVLVGAETWKRKHVDWEIGSSIRDTQHSSRSGLIGILLPTYPRPKNNQNSYTGNNIPPRLYDNIQRGFARLYNWNNNPSNVRNWIHEAFERRNKIIPDNSQENFVNNRSSERWY